MRYEEDDELERMRARREHRQRAWKDEADDFSSGNGRTGTRRTSSSRTRHSASQRSRRKAKKRRIWLIVLEVLLVVALLIGAGIWFMYQKTFGTMQKIEFHEEEVQNLDLTEEQIEEMKGYFTVACFGVDSRAEGKSGQLNVGKGTNADVNMIVRANLETGEVKIVSVFRDTYLNISDKNSYNKINAAYAYGGPEQAVKALNKNLALNITQYATFNWKAVAEAINILGGVDVDLSDAEFSWINAYISETVKETGVPSTQLEHGGHVHLDGIQAVAYARIRYSDTDYARTERQRIVVEKALEKAKQADFKTLYGCMHAIMPQLATNLQPDDLYPLAKVITKFDISDTVMDKKLYCIISPSSFSCGNLVPAAFKSSGVVTLLGRTSGGGSCSVQPASTAWGTMFNYSSPRRLSFLKNGSFYDIDQGVEPDFVINDMSKIYDRQALTDYINHLF